VHGRGRAYGSLMKCVILLYKSKSPPTTSLEVASEHEQAKADKPHNKSREVSWKQTHLGRGFARSRTACFCCSSKKRMRKVPSGCSRKVRAGRQDVHCVDDLLTNRRHFKPAALVQAL
jgi:hypothetical protein